MQSYIDGVAPVPAAPLDPKTEQGIGVYRFTEICGDQHWVAAKDYESAKDHLAQRRPGSIPRLVEDGEVETDLDAVDMLYGDEEDGEELVECTLRDLVRWALAVGWTAPHLIAETR